MFALPILLIVLVCICYYLGRRKYDYWKKKNVPHLPPTFILGNYGPYILLQDAIHEITQKICQKFPNEPMVGAYYGTEPVLLINDPELVKLITTKDFYYFNGREITEHSKREVLTRNMFFTYGDNWKVLRQNMSPMFSSAKMKNMFYIIERYSRVLEKLLDEETAKSPEIDMRPVLARFTMDCICACAFGIDSDAMKKDKNNKFKSIADVIFDSSTIRGLMTVARAIWPQIFYGLGLKLFPESIYQFFRNIILDVFASRNGQPASKHDFIDLLLNLRENKVISGDSMRNLKVQAKEKISLDVDDELLVAQCVLIFAAGFETSATTSTFTLYEIAKHPEVQKKVQEEVDAYLKKRRELQYDCVTELPYLEQCVDEALRLYPVLGVITREVHEDYTMPNGLKLEKGMRIHLPTYHIQRNPKYFKDPEKYNPDRFSPEEKKNIIPYSYFPFGEGPRVCLGMRFAKMQTLAGLVTLLKKYTVELAPGMPKTVGYESRSMVTRSKIGVRLVLRPRPGWEDRVYA